MLCCLARRRASRLALSAKEKFLLLWCLLSMSRAGLCRTRLLSKIVCEVSLLPKAEFILPQSWLYFRGEVAPLCERSLERACVGNFAISVLLLLLLLQQLGDLKEV